MSENNFEFREGDIVKIKGDVNVNNTYLLTCNDSKDYPIMVIFTGEIVLTFTLFGRNLNSDKEAVLELVDRPKKKVKKNIEVKRWVNIYEQDGVCSKIYRSKAEALSMATGGWINSVGLTGSYEVEVDE